MRRILVIAVTVCGMAAGPLSAGPSNNQHFLFATWAECEEYLENLYRGNHAYYCEWTADGWYITEDFTYKEFRKTPNK